MWAGMASRGHDVGLAVVATVGLIVPEAEVVAELVRHREACETGLGELTNFDEGAGALV